MPTVQQIEAMLSDNPDDTFLLYALAMELDNAGDNDRSLTIFDRLMRQKPPYVPAFFMSAQQLARLDRVDEAKVKLQDGIEQARSQNDGHAAGEMSDFLASLE